MTASVLDRLRAGAVITDEGCWEWQRSLNSRGYSLISVSGNAKLGHRVSYELHVGPIPDGLTIDHLRRNRACVNPAHLEPVTDIENKRRSPANYKTHCVHGHALTDDNVIVKPRPNGRTIRNCRTCANGQRRMKTFVSTYLTPETPAPTRQRSACAGDSGRTVLDPRGEPSDPLPPK